MNATIIVLIPKIDVPKKITEYSPTSLCLVVYSSKMLATRLKGILPEIIREEQSAFVSSRINTDNILVAHECIHTTKKKG